MAEFAKRSKCSKEIRGKTECSHHQGLGMHSNHADYVLQANSVPKMCLGAKSILEAYNLISYGSMWWLYRL